MQFASFGYACAITIHSDGSAHTLLHALHYYSRLEPKHQRYLKYIGMKTVRIFSDRIRNRIRLEGLRSIRIRVRISNIRYRIRIRILKSHIYDVDIQSYPIRHS